MKSLKITKSLFLIISLLLHTIAYIQFHYGGEFYDLPPRWTTDFDILFFLSCSFTLIIYIFNKKKNVILLFFILRTITFFIIGIPFGNLLDVEYMLLFSLLVDVIFFTPYPVNLVLSLIILTVSVLLQMPMSIYYIPRSAPSIINMLSYGFFGIIISIIMILLRKTIDENAKDNLIMDGMDGMVTRLIEVNKEYLEYATRIKNESTKNERKRIIQELHDIVGKSFTNIFAMMDASLKYPPSNMDEQKEIFTWAREQAQTGLDETRVVLYRMREMKEPDLKTKTIVNLIETFQQATRVNVKVSWGNLPTYRNTEIELIIYNIIQESLVNAFRHGKASQINIIFWMNEESLLLSIEDNGKGGDSNKKGIGQSGMEKRVSEVGGTIVFRQTKRGYEVQMSIPREEIKKDE